MVNSPIRFMALSSSACTGSPLRCLSEASIPPIAFSRHCSSRKISTPNWRDRSCTGSSRKKPQKRPHACAPPSIAGQVPAGLPAKPGLGKNVDEPSSPAFTTGPSTATFFSKLSVMFRSSLDTSIKPILCPRKSGPTHGQFFDHFSLFDDGGVASKVGVGWSYVADALVVALVVVVIDEGADLVFEIAGQIIIFKQDPVLQRLMPALDLAPGFAGDTVRPERDPYRGPRAIQPDRRRYRTSRCR